MRLTNCREKSYVSSPITHSFFFFFFCRCCVYSNPAVVRQSTIVLWELSGKLSPIILFAANLWNPFDSTIFSAGCPNKEHTFELNLLVCATLLVYQSKPSFIVESERRSEWKRGFCMFFVFCFFGFRSERMNWSTNDCLGWSWVSMDSLLLGSLYKPLLLTHGMFFQFTPRNTASFFWGFTSLYFSVFIFHFLLVTSGLIVLQAPHLIILFRYNFLIFYFSLTRLLSCASGLLYFEVIFYF